MSDPPGLTGDRSGRRSGRARSRLEVGWTGWLTAQLGYILSESQPSEAGRDARAEGWRIRRINRRRRLVPDLDFVAVRVGEEDIGLAGAEFALAQDGATGLFDRLRCGPDVGRIGEAEAEVGDAPGLADPLLAFFEYQHVAAARRLRLDQAGLVVDRDDAEHLLVEA